MTRRPRKHEPPHVEIQRRRAQATEFSNELLKFLAFEDTVGLWEIWWDSQHDELTEAERERLVDQTLRRLYQSGLIYFFRHDWRGSRNVASPDTPLTREETDTELRSRWWKMVPVGDGDVFVDVTGKGRAFAKRLVEHDA